MKYRPRTPKQTCVLEHNGSLFLGNSRDEAFKALSDTGRLSESDDVTCYYVSSKRRFKVAMQPTLV